MDSIVLNDHACGEAVAALAGTDYNPKTCVSICRVKDNLRMGGVIFSHYTGESIAIHSGAWHPRWINRDMLFVTFDYPFNQLGVKRIFGQVPEDNLHARKFNENLGFEYVARIEGVFPRNVACMVMRMDREGCRFLNLRPRHIQAKPYVH
jgi:RimJ/RimL family protein N-acetyltransferase